MARRHRPQPRDNRGRFTKTGIPIWFGIVLAVLVVAAIAVKG